VARLNDLGVDSFKIGGALLGSIAQRLLRSICPHCKEPVELNKHYFSALARGKQAPPEDVVFYRGRGCKKCLGTGYAGRVPIYEVLVMTPALAQAVENGLPTTKLREIAVKEGMVELPTAGLEQVYAGRTTLEEVFYKVSG
jgi:type IV pilus assembly protein PilB